MVLRLDFTSDIPIYMQIRNQIVLGIASGELTAGERPPTIRNLADEAGVNTMTVNKAYALLKQEGYILADRRAGAVVKEREGPQGLSDRLRRDLRMIVAEAKLAGESREAFLDLCGKLYDERETDR